MSNQLNPTYEPSSPPCPPTKRARPSHDVILRFWIWVGRIWVTLFFLLGFGILFNLAMVLLSTPYGTDISGTITDTGTSMAGRQPSYYLLYSFTVDGRPKVASETVGVAIRDRYQLGPRERTLGRPDEVISRDVVVRYFGFGPFSYSGLPQFVSAADKARKIVILAIFWFSITGILMYVIWFRVKTRPV